MYCLLLEIVQFSIVNLFDRINISRVRIWLAHIQKESPCYYSFCIVFVLLRLRVDRMAWVQREREKGRPSSHAMSKSGVEYLSNNAQVLVVITRLCTVLPTGRYVKGAFEWALEAISTRLCILPSQANKTNYIMTRATRSKSNARTCKDVFVISFEAGLSEIIILLSECNLVRALASRPGSESFVKWGIALSVRRRCFS